MNAKLKPVPDELAQAFLDAKLRVQQMTVADLALHCAWSRHAFISQLSAGFPCAPLRWKIESALGFCAIWSPGAEVHLRRRCFETYGLDPRTATLPEVIGLCRRLGVQIPFVRRQEEWVSNLFAWLAANPRTDNETKVKKEI